MNKDELDRANLEAFVLISQRNLGKPKRITAKEKCREKLEDLGIKVQYLHSNKGYWSHRQQDVMSWEFGGTWGKNGLSVCGGSWQSMTECAKYKAFVLSELDEVFEAPVSEPERIHAENLARVSSDSYRRIEKSVARREKAIRRNVNN